MGGWTRRRLVCLAVALSRVWFAVRGQSMVAMADFNDSGVVSGTVTFSQVDPSERVRIAVQLKGMVEGSSWSVNTFPVVTDCSPMSVGAMYNPTNMAVTLACGGGPKANCRTGDLSGKFGALSNKGENVFYDETMTLYGAFSVMHRSVVLSKPDGTPYACATITGSDPQIVLQAHFERGAQPLDGSIWMLQAKESPSSDTVLMVHLNTTDGSSLKGALYHVHEGSMLTPSTPCSALGYHYNPTNTAPCNRDPTQWNNCELGDISGRHGPIDLPALGESRVFMTDTFLPLSGPRSMSGRSVVIHYPNGSRFACAALLPTPRPFYRAASAYTAVNVTTRRRMLRLSKEGDGDGDEW